LKYHPLIDFLLTSQKGQCVLGSLTGAVTSKKVTEVCKGKTRTIFIVLEHNSTCLPDCKIDRSNRDVMSAIVIRWFFVERSSLNK